MQGTLYPFKRFDCIQQQQQQQQFISVFPYKYMVLPTKVLEKNKYIYSR